MKASLRWGILNLSKILFKIRKGVTSPHPTVKNLSISSQNFQRISTLKSFYGRLRRRQINKTDNKFNSENQIETNFCCQVQCAQMDRLFHQCLAIYSMETLHNRIINCQRSSIIAKYFWKVPVWPNLVKLLSTPNNILSKRNLDSIKTFNKLLIYFERNFW